MTEQEQNMTSDRFRFVDLFAGIGGLRRGFEQLGGDVFSQASGTNSRRRHTQQTSIIRQITSSLAISPK
jgi:site-specific DNA-cytosine methylase